MRYILGIFVIIVFLLGCKEKKKSTLEDNIKPEKEIVLEDVNTNTTSETVVETIDSSTLDAHQKAYLFLKKDADSIFYVRNNRINKVGLVDDRGTVLLPKKYDKIYSPDVTNEGYIEIENNKKLGLYNYLKGTTIACEYDLIFPSEMSEFIGIGKKDNQYFYIDSDGGKTEINTAKDIPDYKRILKKFSFDFFSQKNKIITIPEDDKLDEEDQEYYNYALFVPSYLNVLGIMPEMIDDLNEDGPGTRYGTSKIILVKEPENGILAFISKFMEGGGDARGYNIESYYLGGLKNNNTNMNSEVLGSRTMEHGEYYYCEEITSRFIFVNDSIFQYQGMNKTKDLYPKYDHMSLYTNYKIDSNGNIILLDSVRFFDFTKYGVIDSDYFIGCFGKIRGGELYDWDDWNMTISEYLDSRDLDIMRNEIYAEYGYIFTSEKWKKYFEAKPWYTPKHENVDEFLTEIDKANIQTILKAKKEMQEHPEIISKENIMYGLAG